MGVNTPEQAAGAEHNFVLGNNIMTASLDKVVNWSRSRSLWPMTFGLACCAIEMMATGAARFDLDRRWGFCSVRHLVRLTSLLLRVRLPTRCCLLLKRFMSRCLNPNMSSLWEPCASSGGVFDTYSVLQGIDQALPVDVYIPGCPPRPEGLLYGLMKLQEKIMRERNSFGAAIGAGKVIPG